MGNFLVAGSWVTAWNIARVAQLLERTTAMVWGTLARALIAIFARSARIAAVVPAGGTRADTALDNIVAGKLLSDGEVRDDGRPSLPRVSSPATEDVARTGEWLAERLRRPEPTETGRTFEEAWTRPSPATHTSCG